MLYKNHTCYTISSALDYMFLQMKIVKSDQAGFSGRWGGAQVRSRWPRVSALASGSLALGLLLPQVYPLSPQQAPWLPGQCLLAPNFFLPRATPSQPSELDNGGLDRLAPAHQGDLEEQELHRDICGCGLSRAAEELSKKNPRNGMK